MIREHRFVVLVFMDHDTGKILSVQRDYDEGVEVTDNQGYIYEVSTDEAMNRKAVDFLDKLLPIYVRDYT